MEELQLLIAIVVGIFKLLRFIVVGLFRLQLRLLGLGRFARAKPSKAQPIRSAPARAPAAAPRPASSPTRTAVQKLEVELRQLATDADAQAARCASEAANEPFVITLQQLAARARQALSRRIADSAALAERLALVEQLGALAEMVAIMAQQRRDRALLDLLGDSDALADACYRPIVDYCRQRSIRLTSDRARTIIGGDKLFFLSVDDPTGLATIVLPDAWATHLGWWPAIAHEIAHDFYRSVGGLGAELARRLRLVPQPLTDEKGGLRAIDAAVAAWQEELFADAFGTMMLGPAYVLTMSWIFAAPDKPIEACAAMHDDKGGYEEHPPGHVRVACAARLLGAMGYGAEGDQLEDAWRKRHKLPTRVLLPVTGGRWIGLPDGAVIERAGQVGKALYQTGLDALLGMPLRSLASLDFGPREHQLARAVKEALATGRRATVRDPRLVIAGGVLAWMERPADAARIYAAARDLIDGVGTPRRSSASAVGTVGSRDDGPLGTIDATALREAVVLDALLRSPRLRRIGRR